MFKARPLGSDQIIKSESSKRFMCEFNTNFITYCSLVNIPNFNPVNSRRYFVGISTQTRVDARQLQPDILAH